jgi:hypothetical protein
MINLALEILFIGEERTAKCPLLMLQRFAVLAHPGPVEAAKSKKPSSGFHARG